MASQRERIKKGPIRPPPRQATQSSYTQPPASKEDLLGGDTSKIQKVCPGMSTQIEYIQAFQLIFAVVEFSSRAVPQPFLDPSILQRRFQENQQWNLAQERKIPVTDASSSSRAP